MVIVFFKTFITTLLVYFSGLSTSKFLLKSEIKKEIYEYIFLGFIVMGFVALLINFFLPLKILYNSIYFFLVGFISFLFLKNINKNILYNHLILILLISILASILIFKSNIYTPDAGLYHLPYTKILNEEKIIIGLSNLHFRFGHISILQYINAINLNYLNGIIGIVFPIAIIVSTFLIFLGNELKKINNDKEISYQYLLILIFFFSIIYLDRYSNYGNDALGYIYSILTIIYFFKFKKNNNKKINLDFKLLAIFSIFTFLNKPFLILFLFLPLVLLSHKNFFEIIKDKILIFGILLLFFWFIKNILISGCIIYPSSFTCLDLLWTDLEKTRYYGIAGEAASKGYLDIMKYQSGLNDLSMNMFNHDFLWTKIWLKYHFNIVIKKIIPLFVFIFLIFLYKIFSKKNTDILKIKNLIYLLIFSFLGLLFWFLKFPLYRYGVSYISIFLISLFCIFFNTMRFSFFNLKEINFLIIFFIFILIGVNLNRISNNFKLNDNLPDIYLSGKKILYKKILINNQFYYKANTECLYGKNLCTHLDVDLNFKKIKGYKVFY
jgi:hypothetical protein|tara:strand:- start:5665 stop:7317 length:1653 start_codon:yes stop_codon:yes gene_type:complete